MPPEMCPLSYFMDSPNANIELADEPIISASLHRMYSCVEGGHKSLLRCCAPSFPFAAHLGVVGSRAKLDGSSPNGRIFRHQLDGVV
jgi:hypothetical protein